MDPHDEIHHYADGKITERANGPLPTALRIMYLIVLLWGVWALYTYWNGSHGFLDRGGWQELQEFANTKN